MPKYDDSEEAVLSEQALLAAQAMKNIGRPATVQEITAEANRIVRERARVSDGEEERDA